MTPQPPPDPQFDLFVSFIADPPLHDLMVIEALD
jgi:hypothetical protein